MRHLSFKSTSFVISLLVIAYLALDISSLPFLSPATRLGLSTLPYLNGRAPLPIKSNKTSKSPKVALITGGNSGIGLETAKYLVCDSNLNYKVIITCRTEEKGDAAVNEIERACPSLATNKLSYKVLDLASLESIEKFHIGDLNGKLDVLVLNAGLFSEKVTVTQDGYEEMFGAHHIGHFALFKKLEPLLSKNLEKSSPTRVVLTSSALLTDVEKINYDAVTNNDLAGTLETRILYGNSKLANALFAVELQSRYPNWVVTANHPGLVRTPIVKHFTICKRLRSFCFEPEIGAMAILVGILGDAEKVRGAFILPRGSIANPEKDIPFHARDPEAASELWDWTERILRK
jgi:NAD(P)-dependent dehydrogenase (short-subunit alcohol dehydrogenase family)